MLSATCRDKQSRAEYQQETKGEFKLTKIPNGEVSASKFNTAFGRAGCGMKFYYRYIEGIRGAVSAPLLAGIAFDEATRQLHENRITNSIIADPRDVFVEAWENPNETNRDGELIDYDLSEAPADIVERGLNALGVYASTTESMRPIAAQVFVSAEFEETDAKLVGYIDLVEAADDGICISDIKTSISSRKKWTVEDAARDTQLGIYATVYQGDAPVTAVGWRHARLGGKVEVGATHVAAPDKSIIMQRVSYWMGELERWCETGLFPATGAMERDAWVCSEKYCDFYNRCPNGAKARRVIPVTIGGTK